MATGIVFTYLLIAALAAPLLWLMWWVVDSLGGAGRLQASAVSTPRAEANGPAKRQARFDFPRPADMRLPGVQGTVARYGLKGGSVVATCAGPDHAGGCPLASADGTVPCAGSLLALPQPIRGSFEWHIPSGYRACLLGSYDTFRQAPRAN
jgi:hypothetical protein